MDDENGREIKSTDCSIRKKGSLLIDYTKGTITVKHGTDITIEKIDSKDSKRDEQKPLPCDWTDNMETEPEKKVRTGIEQSPNDAVRNLVDIANAGGGKIKLSKNHPSGQPKVMITGENSDAPVPPYSLANAIGLTNSKHAWLIDFQDQSEINSGNVRAQLFSGFADDYYDFVGFAELLKTLPKEYQADYSAFENGPWTTFPIKWPVPDIAGPYKEMKVSDTFVWMDVWTAALLGKYSDIPVVEDSYTAVYNLLTGKIERISVQWDIAKLSEEERTKIIAFAFNIRKSAVDAHKKCRKCAMKVQEIVDQEQRNREKDLRSDQTVRNGFDVRLRKSAIKRMKEGKDLRIQDICVTIKKQEQISIEHESDKAPNPSENEISEVSAAMKDVSDTMHTVSEQVVSMLSSIKFATLNDMSTDDYTTPVTEKVSEPLD